MQQAALLKILLENSPDCIYFKDLERRFIAVSRGLVQRLGQQSASDLLGKTDSDFFGQEHALATALDEQEIVETGHRIVGKLEREDLPDGTVRWVVSTKLPMRDESGRIIGTFGISRDFTAEKEWEDRLNSERSLLRSVIEHIPDPIYVKDLAGVYVLDNGSHRLFLGRHQEEEIVGKTSHDFFPKEQALKFEGDDQRTLESGIPLINREEIVIRSDGSRTWFLTTKVPVKGTQKSPELLVCIGRNVTQQKLAEERLLQTNAELSSTVEKLKEAHQQLRDVQMQLVEAEKLKSVGRLAAGVAHEVKNPLAVLHLGVELLRQTVPATDEESGAVLDEMTNAIARAETVVRGLLDFSAPRKLQQEAADFNEVVRHSLQFVRGELRTHHVKVALELSTDLPLIEMDRQKMEQVLINLLTNAAHAMALKGGTLTIRTRREQLTGVGGNVGHALSENFRIGEWLLITEIEDTGTGIPADKLEHIFQPFFTTKATGSGTGLGLSVSKTIIALHGGIISVKNVPGSGACFSIFLPTP